MLREQQNNKNILIKKKNSHTSGNHNFILFLSLIPVGFVFAAAMTGVFVEVPSVVVISARLQDRWELR